MKYLRLLGMFLLCAGAAAIILTVLLFLSAMRSASQGIGIIGGADAPTAIFLIRRGAFTPYIVAAVMGLAGIVTGILLRRKDKK